MMHFKYGHASGRRPMFILRCNALRSCSLVKFPQKIKRVLVSEILAEFPLLFDAIHTKLRDE